LEERQGRRAVTWSERVVPGRVAPNEKSTLSQGYAPVTTTAAKALILRSGCKKGQQGAGLGDGPCQDQPPCFLRRDCIPSLSGEKL
jgi:hypothetical protein